MRRVRAAERSGLSTPLRFREEVWPHLVRDANEAFYTTLSRSTPLDLPAILDTIDHGDLPTLPQRVRALLPDDVDPFDLPAVFTQRISPCTAEDYRRTILEAVETDLIEADAGLASPVKAALWEVNGARRWAIGRAAFDGIDAEGYDGDLAEFLSFGEGLAAARRHSAPASCWRCWMPAWSTSSARTSTWASKATNSSPILPSSPGPG